MARDTCYYDGACGMCRRTARWLGRLDWLGRLEIVDMGSVDPSELPVPPEAAMRGMPMRTGDGRVLVGFEAVRRALMRTPVGVVVSWPLYLPVASWVGRRVYARVAIHRRRDGACMAGAERADDD